MENNTVFLACVRASHTVHFITVKRLVGERERGQSQPQPQPQPQHTTTELQHIPTMVKQKAAPPFTSTTKHPISASNCSSSFKASIERAKNATTKFGGDDNSER
jgi:hypothetical protein